MTMHPRITAFIAMLGAAVMLVTITPAAFAEDMTRAMMSEANCAPTAGSGAPPAGALRLIGAQKQEARSIFAPGELLVVGGGSAKGLQLGQQFFVRRARDWGMRKSAGIHSVNTVGGIRIVAVNNATAI